MNKPLQALLVEDSAADAKLLLRELRRGGFAVGWERVTTEEGLRLALKQDKWDVILCDYTLPGFSGTRALQVVREVGSDLPFIFVSGTIGEDTAVAAMKAGAQDYVMKGNLARVAPAVDRELREAAVRRQQLQAEEAMRTSEHKYRHLFEGLSDAAFLMAVPKGKIIDTNAQAQSLLGRSRAEILGMHESQLYAPGQSLPAGELPVARACRQPGGWETSIQRKNGSLVPVHISASRLQLYGHVFYLALARDITERKRMLEEVERSISLLRASVEAMADAILVLDNAGRAVSFNQRFLDLLGVPASLVSSPAPAGHLPYLLDRLAKPQTFVAHLRELAAHPERQSCELVRLKDGRVIESLSQPQWLGDQIIGRIWRYRDRTHDAQVQKAWAAPRPADRRPGLVSAAPAAPGGAPAETLKALAAETQRPGGKLNHLPPLRRHAYARAH